MDRKEPTEPKKRRPAAEIAAEIARLGIRCHACGATQEWSVYYTRPIPGGVLRVRICRACGAKTATREYPQCGPREK